MIHLTPTATAPLPNSGKKISKRVDTISSLVLQLRAEFHQDTKIFLGRTLVCLVMRQHHTTLVDFNGFSTLRNLMDLVSLRNHSSTQLRDLWDVKPGLWGVKSSKVSPQSRYLKAGRQQSPLPKQLPKGSAGWEREAPPVK